MSAGGLGGGAAGAFLTGGEAGGAGFVAGCAGAVAGASLADGFVVDALGADGFVTEGFVAAGLAADALGADGFVADGSAAIGLVIAGELDVEGAGAAVVDGPFVGLVDVGAWVVECVAVARLARVGDAATESFASPSNRACPNL